jgi:NADH-quinone oxidoreductase subunit K
MIVPFGQVLALGVLLFLTGACGAMVRRELIMVLIGVEVMLNAAVLVFVAAALHWGQVDGQIFALFIIAVAAAEVAVGLALVLAARGRSGATNRDQFSSLRG